MRLRAKGTLLLTLIVVSLSIISGTVYLHLVETSLKESALTGLRAVAESNASYIERLINECSRASEAIALNIPRDALMKRDSAAIDLYLHQMSKVFPIFDNGMFLLDAKGFLWSDFPPHFETRGRNFSFREYFKRTMATHRGIVGTPYRSARTGKPVLTFTAILNDYTGQPSAILGCSVRLLSDNALGRMRTQRIGKSGNVFVHSTDGLIILNPRDEQVLVKSVVPPVNDPSWTPIKPFEGVGRARDPSGVPVLLAFSLVKGVNWVVSVQQSLEEAYAPISHLRVRIMAIVLLGALATLALGILVLHRFTRPLMILHQAALRFSSEFSREALTTSPRQRDFITELETTQDRDEIGDLFTALRKLFWELDASMGSLEKSAKDWEATFDAVPNMIFILDGQGRIIRFNQTAASRLGISLETAAGQMFGDLAGEGNESLKPALEEIANERLVPFRREVYWPGLDSIFDVTTTPLRDEHGHLQGSVVLGRDITASKLAEESLNLQKAYFQQLFESSPEAIVIQAPDRTIVDVNKGFERLFLYSTDEVRGHLIDNLVAPPDRIGEAESISDAVCNKEIVRTETVRRRKDGSLIDVYLTGFPIEVGDRQVAAYGIYVDISDRKAAERALEAEKERLSVTLRSIADGVIATDIKGKVVLFNPVAERLTGWTQLDARGHLLEEVFCTYEEKTRVRCADPVERALTAGKFPDTISYQVLVARDGSEKLIVESVAPIRDRESVVIGAVIVFRDVTEERRLEQEMAKTEKLESIGILAGGIAHDFNNILTSVLGNISLAKVGGPLPDRALERLQEAEKATLRAKDLTQQLLTFSLGGAPIKHTASVTEVIRDSATFCLRGSNVRCEFIIPEDLRQVEIDEGQISQVINNLIINADQAMPEGGTITISVANTTIGPETVFELPPGDYVCITIKDQGIGIPEQYLPKIFDPYFTTKQKGNGLGLTTTFSVIKRHDGHITVESELGVGTTFRIYLPASDKVVPRPATVEQVPHTGTGRILVMDDEEMVWEVAREMLTYLGYEAQHARDGAEAVELYREADRSGRPFAAVLMDLTIPGGMGGREAIKALLQLDPQVKAIVSSGYSNDPIMSEYQACGFQGVVTKPYRIDELSRVLQDVIAGGEPLSEPR